MIWNLFKTHYSHYNSSAMLRNFIVALLTLLILPLGQELEAQYFGRNKPRYRSFDFEVLQTPTFDIYNYSDNQEMIRRLADWSEEWYASHQAALLDTFTAKNPIIFYNNHAEFQQTNAIQGAVGVGTGGVTEGFKNRVVMPVTMINQQTNQVLGHELVHAFQSLGNIPLWMIEGMAEYLSLGRIDPHTSMWMRDAILNDDIPDIKNMANPKYFPYRYGQAFWTFFGGFYGDHLMEPFFSMTAKYGLPYFQNFINSELSPNMVRSMCCRLQLD